MSTAPTFPGAGDAPAGAVAADDDTGQVVLTVTDTGAGIDPLAAPTLFEPFVQAGEAPTRRAAGLGLGLPIVRAIVELHGGTVEVASEGVGLGAVATVRLPRAAPPRQDMVTVAVKGVSSLEVPTNTV